VGDEGPDADNRVVDVLGEFVAQRLSDFVFGLAVVTIGGSEAPLRSGMVSRFQTRMCVIAS
jgi:hypothetical protein